MQVMNPVLVGDAYQNLLGTLKSKETRIIYDYRLKQFLSFADVKSPDELLKIESKATEKMIQKYIESLKVKGLNRSTVEGCCAPLSKFYSMNDMVLNWKKLHSYLPDKVKTIEDTAYQREQIITMLKFTVKQRSRVVIKLLASSGVRVGGLSGLRKKHLRPIDNLYEITVYARAKEQYITYCSPECRAETEDYFKFREECGEVITNNSPVIRNDFLMKDENTEVAVNAKPTTTCAMKFLLENLIRSSGLKGEHETNEDGKVSQRTTTMRAHAFRKFFDTALIKSKVSGIAIEKLMGWKSQRGLQRNYDRTEQSDLLEEYTKAIPLLTFGEEYQLKIENTELKEKNAEIESLKSQMTMMQEMIVDMREQGMSNSRRRLEDELRRDPNNDELKIKLERHKKTALDLISKGQMREEFYPID